LDKEWALMLKLTVPKRVAKRLRIERDNIIHTIGLNTLIIKEADGADGRQVVVIHAKNAGQSKSGDRLHVQAKSTLELQIPPDLHGLILGTNWKFGVI